jgi:two-component system nitrate/nitrite response regulator NarL
MTEPVRVLLIDDHALCRKALSELLEQRAGMKVIGLTGDPNQALQLVREQKPDMVVMDLRMPLMDGPTLLRRMRGEGCVAPVVILTVSDAPEDMADALRAGVRGYLLKDMEPDDILEAIERAAKGELVVAPAMTLKLARLLQPGPQEPPKENLLNLLTEREREILEHLSRGESNKAIARALQISPDTVKLHVRRILSKLNLASRVEAAIFAVEHRMPARSSEKSEP